MTTLSATAQAYPNIAFIKYWGNRDNSLRLPASGSISMNLDGLITQTCLELDPGLSADTLTLNHQPAPPLALSRMAIFLDLVRLLAGKNLYARVETENNFPTGAGVASSASAFAALAVAAARAYGLTLSQRDLSRLARRGSGSACRSIPAGFVEWKKGNSDRSSYAVSIAPPDHWDLVDLVTVVQSGQKPVGSSEGHALAGTSPLQKARLTSTPQRLAACRHAILAKDFSNLADVAEQDSNLMHAVMMTSTPALFYWEPASLLVMKLVPAWRAQGIAAFYTLDAGPNVHVICLADQAPEVKAKLLELPGVLQVLAASPGGPAHLAERCTLVEKG